MPEHTGLADGQARARAAFAHVEQWLFSEPLAELFGLLGEKLPADGASPEGADATSGAWLHLNEELPSWLGDALERPEAAGLAGSQLAVLGRALAIERLAATVFDFRNTGGAAYRERAQAATADFTDAARSEIARLADRLGLVNPTTPAHPSYDATLVLGGGGRSPLLRAEYAHELERAGTALGRLYLLGSPRFVTDEPPNHERAQVAGYAPGASDEFELMLAAVRATFGYDIAPVRLLCGCTSVDRICPNWKAGTAPGATETPPRYTHERSATLLDPAGASRGEVLSASTGRPPYRPDTTDTFELWGRRAMPAPGSRVLVVTTQVFVPFQTFDGLRRLFLDHAVDVDTIGFGPERGDRALTSEYLLQETLSAIRSGRRLLVAAGGLLRSE